MRKLAAWAAMIVVAILLVPVFVVAAFAQDAVVVTDASPWPAFWQMLWPPLATFLMAVLGLLGAIVSYYAKKIGGSKAEVIANSAYQILLDQAAGWLLEERKNGADVTIDDAVEYLRKSYPEVKDHEPSGAMLGSDIIGAVGRMLAK